MNDDDFPVGRPIDDDEDDVVPSAPITWASVALRASVFAANVFSAASDFAGGIADEFAGHHNHLVDRKAGQELESLLKDD